MSTKQIALITGANKGIGLETARQLGALGITVLLGARNASRGEAAAAELRKHNIDAHHIKLDVTDAATISLAAEQIARRFGKLDILVNNAGTLSEGWSRPTSGATLQEFRDTFDINLFGLVAVTNAMLPCSARAPPSALSISPPSSAPWPNTPTPSLPSTA
jgi:NAD(P)-dependent dehydrogenase (short-subunit alcohol dehydrogenase family)